MKKNLLNVVLFQLGWFACVLSAAQGIPSLGAVIAVIILALHLWLSNYPMEEVKLIFIAMLIGIAWDSFLVWQGLLNYSAGLLHPLLAPYWIVLMWALFASTLNLSMRWLKGKWFYSVLFGAVGGPLAYIAGQKLGAVEFGNEMLALGLLLVGWAVFTPLLMKVSFYFDGFAEKRA